MTPSIWMEARCGSVCTNPGPNWRMPLDCHQTSEDGGFFSDIRSARQHFLRCGWRIIDGEWWCPVCARVLESAG